MLLETQSLAAWLQRWGLPTLQAQPVQAHLAALLPWTESVRLAQVLARPRVPAPAPAAVGLATLRQWADAGCQRLQTELRAGWQEPTLAREAALPARHPAAQAALSYRLHHSQQQRALEHRVAIWRGALRERLAVSGHPDLQQLADLDAVLERALEARAQQAWGAVPAWLLARAQAHESAQGPAWPAALWADLQEALAVEMDWRLQPVMGLLGALGAARSDAQGRMNPK